MASGEATRPAAIHHSVIGAVQTRGLSTRSITRKTFGYGTLAVLVTIVTMMTIGGCGADDGTYTPPSSARTSGIVVGSILRNAKVCLDLNANAQCDDGEPAVRSDASGVFTLPGAGAGIVAEVGTDAVEFDAARGAVPVAARFVFRAPQEAPGVVGLASTSVVAEMESGLVFADAVKKVALAEGVTTAKLLGDFNVEPDAVVRAALQAASDDGIARLQNGLKYAAAGTPVRTTVATATLTDRYLQTKAPYRPQQDVSTYEAPPAGFSVVFTQVLARHGSRGLSSLKYDLAIYNLWKQAQTDQALTPLGAQLGPDVLKIMKANFLLGYDVPGIGTPGYGNETQVGIDEHRQLAVRLLARLPDYWKQIGDASSTAAARKIVFVTSGVDRAVDSGGFFVQSLTTNRPALASTIVKPPAPAPYPDTGVAVAEPAGTDHFLLYFHKLVKATDLVTNTANPLYKTWADSQAYQTYKASDADLLAHQSGLTTSADAKAAGRAVLARLFTPAFIDKIDSGVYKFANTGTFTFTSGDGKFTSTLSGDGKTVIAGVGDAGSLMYELYVIAPAMRTEAAVDFTIYLPAAQARFFASINDASDFYDKGPGMTEKADATYKMAQILLDDFFKEGDAIAKNDLSHAAMLRFAHAEIMIPFASKIGLKDAFQQLPKAVNYSYADDLWRGEYVSRMAANLQWDLYRNASGRVLVKMLYDEKETDFKAACDGAKVAGTMHFYDYAAVRTCYGYP